MERPKKEDYKVTEKEIIDTPKSILSLLLDYQKYIDYLESKEEWISVEDRLPEKGQRVRVSRDNGKSRVIYTIYCGGNQWGDGILNYYADPTHWKPEEKPPVKK